jgi:GGDEF domain-containing protein
MGGDEFVVLAPDIDQEALNEHIQRLQDAVEQTGARLGYPGLSSSIGAVVFVPTEGDIDADAILADADRRMYANKRRNKALAALPFVDKPVQGCLDLIGAGLSTDETARPVSIH